MPLLTSPTKYCKHQQCCVYLMQLTVIYKQMYLTMEEYCVFLPFTETSFVWCLASEHLPVLCWTFEKSLNCPYMYHQGIRDSNKQSFLQPGGLT